MAVTFAIPFSMLGLLLNQLYMTSNAAWIHRADKLLEKGNLRGVRLMTGYKQGKTSLLKVLKNGTIDRIINAFSIVGLMVVGSMSATRVLVNTPLTFAIGEGVTSLQSVLNSLAPGLIPLGITMLVWKCLKKKVNTVWIIIGIFVVGIIGYYTGILGYAGR